MSEDLLALLRLAHPGRPQADLLAMIEATPDAKSSKSSMDPLKPRPGSRPRTSASMERRRSWAAGGWLPPQLASRFTLAEQAVLAVIAEVSVRSERNPACELPLEKIAALAGVCRTSVRNALKQAKALGLLSVEERRQSAWRNLPHRITITSPEWSAWLRMRSRKGSQPEKHSKGGGRKSVHPTSTRSKNLSESRLVTNAQKGFRETEGRVRWRETRF